MSQSEKAAYYQALKAAGVNFDRHYREYSTAELKAAYDKLQEAQPRPEPAAPAAQSVRHYREYSTTELKAAYEKLQESQPQPEPEPGPMPQPVAQPAEPAPGQPGGVGRNDDEAPPASFFGYQDQPAASTPASPPAPVRHRDPNEMAGQRQNSQEPDEPIRVDPDTGRIWYQEEVRKPAYPKPRGRRVLKYLDPGVKEQKAQVGQYVEGFEVAGDPANARPAEVKVTLPSYQVGIYKDPRFPFKVVCYNGNEGFDLFEVQRYYGGAELVPKEIKRKYVENVLCYDIRTTIRAIQDEYRQLQLTGKLR